MRTLSTVSVGEILKNKFSKPLGLTKTRWPKTSVCRRSASATLWLANQPSAPAPISACAAALVYMVAGVLPGQASFVAAVIFEAMR